MGRKEAMLGAIWSCAALVLEHLEPALRALHAQSMIKVRVCMQAGAARLQAVGPMGAATAVRWKHDLRANGAQHVHVRRAFAWRVRRAVLNLVKDRVRVSLVAFA